jgi:hypothetical protein
LEEKGFKFQNLTALLEKRGRKYSVFKFKIINKP